MMKQLLFILLIFSMVVCAVGAVDLKSGITETTKTSVNLTEGKMTYTDKVSGISVTTATKMDGVDLKATAATVDKGDYTFSDDKGVATFKYTYQNDKIKEIIILKEDKILSYPVMLAPNTKIIQFGNTWKIVSTDVRESRSLIADVPFGIDNSGRRIDMYYTYENGELVLQYNRNLIIYNDTLTHQLNDVSSSQVYSDENKSYLTSTYLIPKYDILQIQYPLTIDPQWGTSVGVAEFTSNVTSGNILPFTVQFNTTSATGYAWYFGDESYNNSWYTTNLSSGYIARCQVGSTVQPDGDFFIVGGGCSAYYNDTWYTANNGTTWIRSNASGGWTPRSYLSLSNFAASGTLILTGGDASGTRYNDTWTSNSGATWTLVNASSGWSARCQHSTLGLYNGSIVLIGGLDGTLKNDTWITTTSGNSWSLINSSSGWSARSKHSTTLLPDNSIILTGGTDAGSNKNDTWRSINAGATWTLMNSSSGWFARSGHKIIGMPDNSIILYGGGLNDTWRSSDLGATWTRINITTGFVAKYNFAAGLLPNGTILVTSGDGGSGRNDTYIFNPSGSNIKNASHTYTTTLTSMKYNVSFQMYNANGFNNTRMVEYISILPYANFTSNVTSGIAPTDVMFNDTSLNSPSSWQWSFGDTFTNTSKNVTHTYTSGGNYTVSLTATNAAGLNTTTKTGYINISGGTPYAEFTANTTTGVNPLTVQFTDQTNASTTAWNWTFGMGGAGNYSNSQNPVKTFTGAGRYNVTLNASSGSFSNITLKAYYINVTAALTNPTGYLNITPSPMIMYATLNDTMQLNARNITAKFIYANISFNKTYITAISTINNFSVYPGLTVTSTINNASSQGFMYMNISKNDGSNIVIGSTLTPIVDIRFGVLNATNLTAPINFNTSSAYLTTFDTEVINTTVPGVITTAQPYFTFNVRLVNSATSSTINTLAKINTSGSNITPLYTETSTGYATFSSNNSEVRFNVTCDGYYPFSQAILIGGTGQIDLVLTPLSGPSQSTWYSPHQVRMTIVDDTYGTKLVGATINITPITNTFPIGSQSDYLVNIYGLNPAAANDMMNGTLIMRGISGSDGSATFTMLSSIGYNVNVKNDSIGLDMNAQVYPIENDYNIRVSTSGAPDTTMEDINQTALTYVAPNASYGMFGLTYSDKSGLTTAVNFSVFNASNGSNLVYTTTIAPGSSVNYVNYTIPAVSGQQYIWTFNATRTASPPYIEAGMGATMKNFTLVSLGIENIPGMTLTKASLYYNWISMGFLFMLGAMSSKRMTRFFAILIPVFAALFAFFGWLHAPNMVATYGIIIMTGIMGVVTYMKGSLRENFGGGGPGSLIVNLVFYLIILQTCVGLVTATGVFTNPTTNISVNGAVVPSEYQMNSPNADLKTIVPGVSNSGGLLNDALGTAGILGQLAISCIMMLIKIVVSIAAFSVVIAQTFPFIAQNPLGLFMLAAIQIGIWFAYVLFFINIMAKPFPDATAF